MSTTMHGFVMLGKTIPEPSKRDSGRIYVCSAGWHPDHGLTRVYPLGRRQAPARWDVCSVDLERNPMDSRRESWRLAGDRTNPNVNSECFRTTGRYSPSEKEQLLVDMTSRGLFVESIEEANARRLSLAVMTPDSMDISLEMNEDSPDSPQLRLFDDGLPLVEGARRFPYIPRLHFKGAHKSGLLLREWGCFEWMRKQPGRERELTEALHIGPASAVLVGNLATQRTTWIAIAVLNIRRPQMALTWEASA